MRKPTLYNLKMWAVCAVAIFGVCLMIPGLLYFGAIRLITGEDWYTEIFG